MGVPKVVDARKASLHSVSTNINTVKRNYRYVMTLLGPRKMEAIFFSKKVVSYDRTNIVVCPYQGLSCRVTAGSTTT